MLKSHAKSSGLQRFTANGPAVEGVNVTRRSHPVTCPGSLAGICPGGEEGMARFLHPTDLFLYFYVMLGIRSGSPGTVCSYLYVLRGTIIVKCWLFIPL